MKGTFSDFISKTNEILPKDYRQILKVVQPASKHPIYEKFIKSDTTLSPSCYEFLQKDVDYVKSINSTRIIHAKDFYKGYNDEWSGIEQSLDATRLAVDDILMKRFIIDETEHEGKIELIVMLGHAGSGKTIIMRRIAWNAAKDLNFLCLYLKDGGQIDTYSIQEIINLTGERVFLFVDNISKRIREIKHLINNIGVEGQKLTIVGCERLNEWNMYCEELLPIVTSKYQVKYLEPCEIDFLINLLEEHKSLGTLSDKSREECKIAFAERAGRQLLVALHEATLGKKYEDIIVDEYNNITPKPAQLIYLSICVLNRLDVPVRAGIISRIHGIPFEEFQNKFFKPLEHVIFTKFNSYINDYEYRARHQHIAQIVFENILRNKEDRFNEYLRCLKELNVSYSSDDKAFRQMIRAAELLSLFSDTEQVKHIFNEAYDVVGEDPYLYHQMAIYEMKRSGGNLKKCQSLLVKALELSPDNDIIKHSFAEYNLLMVDKVDTELEKEKLRNQTISIANSLIKSTFGANYAYHTLIKVGLKKIEDYKSNGFTITSKELEETIKEIQKNLTEGLQRYPGNSYLLSAESELAEHLSNSEKVFSSLEKAFSANMRNTYKMYVLKGELKQAKDILEKALDANNNDSKLHYYYSKLLIETEYSDSDAIIYHLQRSFSTGDRNYDARLLYVRQLFIINKMNDEYRSVYSELSKSKVSFDERTKRLYPLKVKFTGQINRIGSTYCLIIREGIGDTIYSRREDIAEEVFLRLTNNTRVYFKIAFNFRGPIAIDVEIINF
jgi:replication-associated recombination protein RarA